MFEDRLSAVLISKENCSAGLSGAGFEAVHLRDEKTSNGDASGEPQHCLRWVQNRCSIFQCMLRSIAKFPQPKKKTHPQQSGLCKKRKRRALVVSYRAPSTHNLYNPNLPQSLLTPLLSNASNNSGLAAKHSLALAYRIQHLVRL